jgi:branched-chain amino acid transport system substrate-binding protein
MGVPAAALAVGFGLPAFADDKTVTVGINLPLTGADAQAALKIKQGAQMALDDANAAGGVDGYKINILVLDDGTATAGQYDPAQAATNARKMVSDSSVVAAIGPQMSGSGKAMSPILSEGDLAIITPSSTNPDITNPKFASQYRPGGKAIYFRTVTTDAFQGPNMANYYADTLKVKAIYILDDSGAYGVGIADSFQGQAEKRGLKILGRDQLNPKEADYTTVLTKIKSMDPDGIYYGGVAQAGVKLAKQSYDILPKIVKGGGDGMHSTDLLSGAGFPAAEGWYCTIAAPHVFDKPEVATWAKKFQDKFGGPPEDYSVTAYDAALVILDAIKRVAASGKPVNRDNVRDAIQSAKLQTLQGEVSFDGNGDINNRIVSVFRITKDDKYALNDTVHQYKYVGVAPASV